MSGPGLSPHLASHKSGGRDLWSAPNPARPHDPVAAIWAALGEVLDPEIPVSLVDLGLVYGVELRDGAVEVRLTFTATACPCMEFIREDVTERLLREPWIRAVRIEDVWSPPWTEAKITGEGRRKLRALGVSA
jgi:metal-sulfur cluster biosynthetic enzyme